MSDHDNWSDPSKAARPSWGKEAEDKLFDALDSEHGFMEGPLSYPGGRVDKEALLQALSGHAEKLFLMLESESQTREVHGLFPL